MGDEKLVQLYGGFLANASDDSNKKTESVSGKQKTKKTNKKKGSSAEQGGENATGNGKRGRPRVDRRTDESAVERRRKQIRLAQRAYRERKETTISDLERRVAALNDIIGEMNQTFLDYNAKAISSGILTWNSTLGNELKEVTERFLHLAKTASLDTNDNDSSEQSIPESHQDIECEPTPSQVPPGQGENNWMAPVVEIPQRYQPTTPADLLGYDFTYEDVSTEIPPMDSSGLAASPYSKPHSQNSLSNNQNEFENWTLQANDSNAVAKQSNWLPSIGMSLEAPSTYSFQETTFARRLYRAAFEKIYCLLRDPYVPRDVIQRKLRFTFASGVDPKTVEQNVLNVLSRNTREPLDYWAYPSGGYSVKTGPNRHPFGPLTEPEARKLSAQQLARLARIDGTWLDPYDVERYLKSKGLRVTGSSSLVEMEVQDSLPPLSSDVVENSPQSISSDSFEGTPSPRNLIDPSINLFGMTQSQPFESTDTGFPDFFHPVSQDVATQYADLQPQTNPLKDFKDVSMYQAGMFSGLLDFDFTPGKRKVVVNVDKLANILIENGECIGQGPGYQKELVDIAFSASLQDTF